MDFILDGIMGAFHLLFSFDEETYSAIKATVFTSSFSVVIALLIGMPLGFCLGYYEFRGRKILKLISDTGLAMPTVAVGLILYALLSHRGPLGSFGLLFTLKAVIIGQICLSLPIVISLTASVIENMGKKHALLLKSYHLKGYKKVLTILFENRYSLMVVLATAYGRIVAEVGVAMMIGGNIKWFTRTITTAISLETNKGQFSMGIALALVLILLAFLVNLAVYELKRLDR
ncbi:tungstate ABC transporter permease TupB [Campylobacter geochelonis]|uniref:ABC transporter permease n=1 Tax=Campylobacter geochelonis TaxID=1780362 RepID=A0A128EPW9_9BACT|nr:tungstate ABC transporter permease TupB [Campylobacter geochelonis]QKF71723.1 tungsten ABC transporter TupABC, permease protein [Campylobacter geochelonis]CZE47654.1 ABC transporter permease [Campylobacter geochelonis]CZE48564.1 ABC transporter permease [Campylobacter geochelonis]CZE51141.1 ABC transporter permease [Campylobacter geochelonis]